MGVRSVEGGTLTKGTGDGVLFNDTDTDAGDTLVAILVTSVKNGTLTLSGDGSFNYVHDGSETTGDSFTYKANDGKADSNNVATVTITVTPVNDLPVAVNDAYTVVEGGTLTVSSGDGLLKNDTDAENNTLTAILVGNPGKGTLTLNSDGSFIYVHSGGESATDSFTYKANDGGTGDSNVAVVSITVTPVNDAPVAVDDSYTTAEGGTLTVSSGDGVLKNDTDAENDTLTVVRTSFPQHGTVTLNSDGSFTYVHDGSETTGDSFKYRAFGPSDSNIATVSITVTPVNDLPVATGDSYAVLEGGTVTADAAAGVLTNDADAENNSEAG